MIINHDHWVCSHQCCLNLGLGIDPLIEHVNVIMIQIKSTYLIWIETTKESSHELLKFGKID